MIGGPSYEWRAAAKATDATDGFITGAPGSERPEPCHVQRPRQSSKRAFIVHGHDHALKSDLEVLVREIGLEPIVLHRQPDEELTVIEKSERHSDVKFAFALLTPDDLAFPAAELGVVSTTPLDGSQEEIEQAVERRARQNVVFEYGYFAGKLGRSNVCCTYKEGVVLPSALSGLLYKPVRSAISEIGYELIKELKAAGLDPGV